MISRSVTGVEVSRGLSYLFMWGSGGSLGAGHYASCVVAAFAAGVCFVLTYLLDPR